MRIYRIDRDDAPEITDKWIEPADLYQGDKLLRRGHGRPMDKHKAAATILFNDDTLDAFKAIGPHRHK